MLLLLMSLISFFGLASWAHAEALDNKPTPIRTFQDDMEAIILNDNLNRIVSFGVVYTSFNMVVPTGVNVATITLPTPQKDLNYGVIVSASSGTYSVLSKSTTGYRLAHEYPTAQHTVDHIVVR